MTQRRVTVKDVAKHAGVSQATVSYVINDTPGQAIPAPTREKVWNAVRELGYTPSRAARALRSGRSDIVLLLLPNAPIGDNIANLIEWVGDTLDDHGYLAVYRRKRPGQSILKLVAELAPAVVVWMASVDDDDRRWIQNATIPVLWSAFDNEESLGNARRMQIPQADAAAAQIDHLIGRGHSKIGAIMPTDPQLTMFAEPRLDSIRARCAELGLEEPVVARMGLDVESAARAVAQWRAAGVTAVAAYNDEYAIAVLAGLDHHGLTAPEGLAVIGVDNIRLGKLSRPPLTTVDLHIEVVTAWTINEVLRALGVPDPGSEDLHKAPISLVVRQST